MEVYKSLKFEIEGLKAESMGGKKEMHKGST